MGEDSKIEWCDATFNPVIGCRKVSPACTNCYAEEFARRRLGRPELWREERHITSASTWNLPEKLDRKAAKEGRRMRLFVSSLSDVFEDHSVWDAEAPASAPWARSIGVALRTVALRKLAKLKNIDVLLLTKRPENVLAMVPPEWLRNEHPAAAEIVGPAWPAHVWVGTTVEDQKRAEERLDHLRRVPAAVRFVSYEPALGPVDFRPWLGGCLCSVSYEDGVGMHSPTCPATQPRGVHWVIAGGESGPGARPSHPDWFRPVRDQCAWAGVPFLFKQWGEWSPVERFEDRRDGDVWLRYSDGYRFGPWLPGDAKRQYTNAVVVRRVGKRSAGRLLDGRIHDGYPVGPL